MKEVFENIIEKLECEYENLKEMYKRTKDMSFYFTFQGVNKAIEIVKKESEKYKDGHFGCNTNGEHERCDGCGLTNCKSRNKIWFGAGGDDTDTNVGSNGWIPVSERLPDEAFGCLVTVMDCNPSTQTDFENILPYFVGYDGETWNDADGEEIPFEVVAWQPLPEPYQPNACKDTDCPYNDGNECPAADGCAGYERKRTNFDMCCESMEAMAQIIDIAKIGWTKDKIMEWLQSEVEE